MPLYFGLPITCSESFRLFNLDFEKTKQNIMKENKLTENNFMDCYFIDYLNNFFKNEKMKMKVFYMDKGQCIIGYEVFRKLQLRQNLSVLLHPVSPLPGQALQGSAEIKEVSNFEKKFINADQLIIQLTNLKILFAIETNNYEENFMEVKLEHMEDEPEIISFPVPYVIEFNC